MSQRAHPRVRPKPNSPVEVQIMGAGFLEVVHARDISVGGLSVYVKHGFEGCDLESRVELIITLPGRRSFTARGVVRHKAAAGTFFGIQIDEIAPENARRIEQYVEARLGEGGAV